MRKELQNGSIAATSVVLLLLIIAINAVFFANITPFDTWKQKLATLKDNYRSKEVKDDDTVMEPVELLMSRLVRGQNRIQLNSTGFSCHKDIHSDVCVTSKPVRIDIKALKVYIPSYESELNQTIKPYARKDDEIAMNKVSPVKILKSDSNLPACQSTSDIPAVIFSTGGYTWNQFHEFNELIIPLFITCRHFQSNVQFIITDYNAYWVSRYNRVLSMLSKNNVISAENASVHCFQGAVIGLKYHDNLALNRTDIPGGYSMADFKSFLWKAYNLKRINVPQRGKPVLMLLSRQNTRVFLNEEKMVDLIKEVGFEVMVSTPDQMSNLDKFSEVANLCSVIVGVHGAGLANAMFLPTGAVMVQVVPLGMDWVATHLYEMPSSEMGIKYIEYKIEPEESSLYVKYGKDDPVITNPASVINKGYYTSVYVYGQNVTINLNRFKEALIKAKELLVDSTPVS